MSKKEKILIIDDDKDLVKLYQQKFVTKGYEVVIAYDGLDGLEKATSQKPDMILLDIILPKLDGVMLFRKLKSQEETANLPVILLTNVDDKKAIVECFKLGAIEYLQKSNATPQQVAKKVEGFLGSQARS